MGNNRHSLLMLGQAYELTIYFIWKVSDNTSFGSNNASRSSAIATRRRRSNRQQAQIARLVAQQEQQGQVLRLLARRTDFLDVQTRDQGVQCRLVQAPPTPPQPVVRLEAEVAGVQRLTG
jgi:hypothetical protein